MASLSIPEEYQDGIAEVLSLSYEVFEKLVAAIQSVPPKLFPMDLFTEVTPKVPDVAPDDLEEIIDAIHSLYIAGLHHDLSPSELAEDITEAIEEGDLEDFPISSESREQIKARLMRLLDIDSLKISSQAVRELRNEEKLFCTARVVTDIRPIFGAGLKESPNAAVILHTLNISYHRKDKLMNFYVALDTDDIKNLRRALDEADLKANSLRSLFEKANISCVEAE